MWPPNSLVLIGARSVLVALPLIGWAGDGVTVWLSLGTAPDFARLAMFVFPGFLVLCAGAAGPEGLERMAE
jgi:hypothetical protein